MSEWTRSHKALHGYHDEQGSRNAPVTMDDLPGCRRPGVRRCVQEWDPVTWGGEVDDNLDVDYEEERFCETCGSLLPPPERHNHRPRRYCKPSCWPSSYHSREGAK